MTALKTRLVKKIKESGPVSVAEYMTLCLLDPKDGYYPTRDPLGSEGDFITAPEISQMFGEVLGLWVIQTWRDMGRPARINLVELGPGRGIMMSDILRTLALDPDLIKALSIAFIEASPALENVQADTLKNAPVPVTWVKDIRALPSMPTVIIGNEFLDCLPIRQYVQKDPFAGAKGFHERMVTLDEHGELGFGLNPAPIATPAQEDLPLAHKEARTDDLIELCPAFSDLCDQLSERFSVHSGRALFIDYGPETTEFGDTLQALKRHKKIDVFAMPGESDLTARVDFSALKHKAHKAGLSATQSVTQQKFLSKLGIEMRAVALSRSANDADTAKIARQLARLTDSDQMGTLFKAICLQSSTLPLPLGFRDMTS